MTRDIQHRDITDPIGRIVREHLGRLGIAAIDHGPLAQELAAEITSIVGRAIIQGNLQGLGIAESWMQNAASAASLHPEARAALQEGQRSLKELAAQLAEAG